MKNLIDSAKDKINNLPDNDLKRAIGIVSRELVNDNAIIRSNRYHSEKSEEQSNKEPITRASIESMMYREIEEAKSKWSKEDSIMSEQELIEILTNSQEKQSNEQENVSPQIEERD